MKIIETDSFDRDYPNESFVNLPRMTKEHAETVANAINSGFHDMYPRFWRAVENDYVLQPGFEP